MNMQLIMILASGIVSVIGALIVWAIRDVKLAIISNTKEVNELKVEVAKLQTVVSHGDKRIEKLENDNTEQWRCIRKLKQSKEI